MSFDCFVFIHPPEILILSDVNIISSYHVLIMGLISDMSYSIEEREKVLYPTFLSNNNMLIGFLKQQHSRCWLKCPLCASDCGIALDTTGHYILLEIYFIGHTYTNIIYQHIPIIIYYSLANNQNFNTVSLDLSVSGLLLHSIYIQQT